ncbi:MAG TPA: hypothetical protein VFT72_13275 [Opitutaceae bacterium]|nr:hypothetical protein [Opitutaceae bacterium]
MNASTDDSLSPRSPTPAYVPGYVGAKRLMLAFGLGLVAFGAIQLWSPLRLTWFGVHTTAEAVSVIKEKPGLPALTLNTDAQVLAQTALADRNVVFWNLFKFQTQDGKTVIVRAGTGSQMKPLYSLSSWDGLPTSDSVWYDPREPERAIFPLIVSTWLAPAVVLFAGALCTIIAAYLLYWARKPIEVPHVAALDANS